MIQPTPCIDLKCYIYSDYISGLRPWLYTECGRARYTGAGKHAERITAATVTASCGAWARRAQREITIPKDPVISSRWIPESADMEE
jgi:hypothetical protein